MGFDPTKLKNFNEWAKDKAPMLATAGYIIASGAEDFLEFLAKIKVGERIEGYIFLPPTPEWLSLYRNHRRIHKGVVTAFRNLNNDTAKVMDYYEFLLECFKTIKGMTNKEIKEIIEGTPFEERQEYITDARKKYEEHKKFFMDILDDEGDQETEYDDAEKKRIRKVLLTPEMIFYYRVWVPCFLIYGTYPTYLLRKARQGDENALKKMLRLDKYVIDDSKINEIFRQAAIAKRRGKMELIAKALAETPKVKIELKRIKYTLAGLISLISIAMGQKLTAVEINNLFDAIAKDTGKGNIDPDFIDQDWTIEKAILRARSFWQTIPLEDKK